LATIGFSQEKQNASSDVHVNAPLRICGETTETNRLLTDYPEFGVLQEMEQTNFQEEYESYLETWSPWDRSLYVIPVVVHIVHLGGSENISDAQVYSGIEQMNLDFNTDNPDLDATIAEFAGVIGDCDIEFRLATKDPDGNCHSGITRTYSETTYDVGNSGSSNHPIVDAVEDVHGTWPQNKYMNIFICIDPNGNGGYTFRPTNWFPSSRMYGSIFLRSDYMGIIGTSNSARRHTLSHEAGHWLNLSHPWGNNNSPGNAASCAIDDGVVDTPNTIGWNNCSDVHGETCGSLDNVQNIMDYSYCSTMFTEGQAARVQTALLGGAGQRYKLSTPANLAATGTDGPGDLCAAQFSSSHNSVCVGSTIVFADESFHAVTARNWTFTGGSPSSSISENPSITYDTPGVYPVSLSVSNISGDTESSTIVDYIVVLPISGDAIPYSEKFETLTGLPDNDRIMVENGQTDVTWELSTLASYSGSKSAYLANYGVNNGSKDALVSGTIDLSSLSGSDELVFNFKYAYKRKTAETDERLQIFVSKDCGETWALRKNVHGDDLGPGVSGANYVPAGAWEWHQVNIVNVYSDYFVENFRYKIEFENDNGNNIFIDDINIYPSYLADLTDQEANNFGVSVYPNPLKEKTTIKLNAVAGEVYTISLYNSLGQVIGNIYNDELIEGENSIDWTTANLSKGIYVLRIESQGQIQSIKLIKD